MNNLRALPIITSNSLIKTTESKLIEMLDLDKQIKELEAYYKLLKEEVIEEYFNDYPEYKTSRGLLLATYKGIERTNFQQSAFEEAHPELFKAFMQTKMSFRFDLKR